jgi:isopentenyldiphosphate isomerase
MTELWQGYDEQGRPVSGVGLTKRQCGDGALHGASHVWIWRLREGQPEILLQRRAPGKPTWGGFLDISAAGHIDQDEDPVQAALRETEEELGLRLNPDDLSLIGVRRARLKHGEIIENEFQWLYLVELTSDAELALQKAEVHSTVWHGLEQVRVDVTSPQPHDHYVPHGAAYFANVLEAVKYASARAGS